MKSVVDLASTDLETFNLKDLLKLAEYYKVSIDQPFGTVISDLASKIINNRVRTANFDGDNDSDGEFYPVMDSIDIPEEEMYPVVGFDDSEESEDSIVDDTLYPVVGVDDDEEYEYPVTNIYEEIPLTFDPDEYSSFKPGTITGAEVKQTNEAIVEIAIFNRVKELRKKLQLPKEVSDIPNEYLAMAITPAGFVLPKSILSKVTDANQEPAEFLGDAVLDLAIIDYLYFSTPHFKRKSGLLTERKVGIVRNANLDRIFKDMCRFIIIGTDKKTVTAKVCADTLESIIGVMYTHLKEKGNCNPISIIQHWLIHTIKIIPKSKLELRDYNTKMSTDFVKDRIDKQKYTSDILNKEVIEKPPIVIEKKNKVKKNKLLNPVAVKRTPPLPKVAKKVSNPDTKHPTMVIKEVFEHPENKFGKADYAEFYNDKDKTWTIRLSVPSGIDYDGEYLGRGKSTSKKEAKRLAAKEAVDVLKELGYV